jgi:tetratricopeptide (TPR) repeat protein
MTTFPPDRVPPLEAALRHSDLGEFARATGLLEQALGAPADAEARARLVTALAGVARRAGAAGNLVAAHAALAVTARAVEWADVFCQLGEACARLGRHAEARAAFDRALALNPRYRTAVVERALLDASEGRIAEAMQTLRVLASESTPIEPVAFQQGLERLGQAEFEDAAPLLRRALDGGDGWLEQRLRRYQELLDGGETQSALASLRTAAAERPGYPDLQLLLGAHERQAGALDDALQSLVHALELNPGYHAARVELARTLETLGDTPTALRQLELVLAAEPAHAEATALHAHLLSRRRGARAETASNRS